MGNDGLCKSCLSAENLKIGQYANLFDLQSLLYFMQAMYSFETFPISILRRTRDPKTRVRGKSKPVSHGLRMQTVKSELCENSGITDLKGENRTSKCNVLPQEGSVSEK